MEICGFGSLFHVCDLTYLLVITQKTCFRYVFVSVLKM